MPICVKRTQHFSAWLMAGIAWLAAPAKADQNHYINMLVGDRASGMSGAYTAISDDPSGLYYNPAGIVYAPGSNLSASMNAFNLTRTVYKGVIDGQDWLRTSSTLLPNFFGVIQPLGPGVLGLSYAVPDSILEDQDQQFTGVGTNLSSTDKADYTINFNNQDTTYNAGPSYAFSITRNFSVGLTMYGYQRAEELILNQVIELPSGHHWDNGYIHIEEYGVKPVFGAMWSPFNRLSLGFSASKIFMLYGTSFVQRTCATTYATTDTLCEADTLNLQKQTARIGHTFPWTGNFGMAYFVNSALLLSGQASLYENLRGGKLPLWNAAGGLEFYLTPRLALRAGAYSDRANTREVASGGTNQAEHIDLYGGSLSLTRFTRTSAISLGGNFALGKGQAQMLSGNTAIQDVNMLTASVFMSASYSY